MKNRTQFKLPRISIHRRIKCNCGHYMKNHYLEEGQCDRCGCTWY